MDATKKDLFKAIHDKCKICAKERGTTPLECKREPCPLFPYRSDHIAKQTDIFRTTDIDIFMAEVLKAANSYEGEPFFWSELRSDVGLRPLHDNWWGVSTKMLKKNGFKVIEGAKRSTHPSRCGAFDRQWKKK